MSVSGWRRDYTPVDEGLSDASNSDSDSAAHPLNPSRPAPRLSSYAEYANKLPPLVRRPPEDLRVVRYNPFSLFLIRLCPTIAVVVWGATLLGLLGAWYWIDGREQYKWYLGAIPYISDVGAVHQSFFIAGCVITAVFFSGSLWCERYLRAKRVLVEATEERLLWVSIGVVDVMLGLLASAALIGLSCYNAFNHPQAHNIFMSTFIVGVAMSGLLQTSEVEHLWHEHPDRHDLRDATILKWIFLSIAVASGASFWILYAVCDGDASRSTECYKITTASAVMEWAACFMTVAYLGTLCVDLWPAYRHAPIQQPAWANRNGVQGVVLANGDVHEMRQAPTATPLLLRGRGGG